MPQILIVEDDPKIVDILSEHFKNLGVSIQHANRMDAALELFKANQFDVVLTDFHIQQGSGRRLLYEIRKINKEVPVYLMTGTPYITESDLQNYSFNGVFLKPFRIKELSLELQKHFTRHK